ncbi:MAG: Bug family tripartite tricarboxylate transporter substrate binding protein [Burkholderiaceae bacterium]
MKVRSRREALLQLLACASVPISARAQGKGSSYPVRPIKFVINDRAGGTVDAVARQIARKLETALGQPVVPDNRPGGSGILSTDLVAKASPDGYTLLYSLSDPVVLHPLTMKKLPYDPQKDLAVVSHIQKRITTFISSATLPCASLKEFVSYAKERPQALSFASWGVGSQGHLAGEYLNREAGLKLVHVPYPAMGYAIVDLTNGLVSSGFGPPAIARQFLENKKARALAVTGRTRSPVLPEVPTFGEVGLPALDHLVSWHSIYAPGGTPEPILAQLNAEIVKLMMDAELRENIINIHGGEPAATGLAEARSILEEDRKRWQIIVRSLGDIPLS